MQRNVNERGREQKKNNVAQIQRLRQSVTDAKVEFLLSTNRIFLNALNFRSQQQTWNGNNLFDRLIDKFIAVIIFELIVFLL